MKKPGKRHRNLEALKKLDSMTEPQTAPKLSAVPEMVVDDGPPASPELTAARHEAGILNEVFSMLGQATIRAMQAPRAKEILDYIQARVTEAEARVEAQIFADGQKSVAEPPTPTDGQAS